MDSSAKRIATQRIQTLFHFAKETLHENPSLSTRYVTIARKIAMTARIRLAGEYKRVMCRHCKSFLTSTNYRVRIRQQREPHLVGTCLNCGKQMRIPLKNKGENKL